MKTGASKRKTVSANWNIRGVDHETREAAKMAARRQGKTIGEWINTAIYEMAAIELKDPPVPAIDQSETLAQIVAMMDKRASMPWYKRPFAA